MSGEHLNQQDLQVVVLGPIESAKTSVITTVLGQRTEYESGKKTGDCVKREGRVGGRKLTFIDTPSWVGYFPSTDTAVVIKHKIMLSVSMCRPGPHAFILAIGIDVPFNEKNRKSIEEHLGLFGEKVWDHTIVVFTCGEYLESKSIEHHTESEEEALTWLNEKCGNRCHMFNTDSREGCNKVSELLEQIDILARTRNSYFELDEKILREVEEKRNTYRERAQQRRQKVQDQREILQKYESIPSLPELKILLLGWLFSGKTSAKNTILGQVEDAVITRTYQSERTSGKVAGKRVSVVDTPGWWKYIPVEYTPEWLKTELQRGLTLDSKSPHAILLAVPVDTTFLEEQRKITEDNMKMFGDDIWRHTMVLFTCGDVLGDTTIEEHIESEGEPLRWLVEKCGNRYHVLSWYDKEDQVMELLKKIEEMMAGICLFRPELGAQKPVDKKTAETLMEVPKEMVHFLDQKWQKLDRELEEEIGKISTETTLKMTKSLIDPLDFRDDHPPSENTLEEINSGKWISPQSPPESKSSINISGIINATMGHEDQEQTHEDHAGQMERMKEMLERMKEMLEREWGRRESAITGRFQHQLSGMLSETDVLDLHRSFRKVVMWMHHGTSGHGSFEDFDTEEIDSC
ncbi:GTPase IMAP family member 8-like isoform X2 [Alosa pseudoharengus]|uniref:GTPase IMAP family member 8-like isoform X2 n=1 Tax=Alosa pseudoharengus TaxID=34774 RepID=UPI003F898743